MINLPESYRELLIDLVFNKLDSMEISDSEDRRAVMMMERCLQELTAAPRQRSAPSIAA